MPEALPYLMVFVVSACVGSFLNVCIFRVPEGKSIVSPASSCPGCNTPIKFYDNIPILSWLLLGGRCRSCGSSISIEYPLVEAITGVFGLTLFIRFGPTLDFFVWSLFIAALVVITFIDLRHRIIPNVISLPGIGVGFSASVLLSYPEFVSGALYSFAGILLGGGLLLTIATAYHKATGKEGMGGGDIKLLAMIGAFLGWKGVLFTLFTASLAGAVIGGGIMLAKGKDSRYAVPFGPFLALGALGSLLFGEAVTGWYLKSMWGL